MKKAAKEKPGIPEVFIHGNLAEAINLVARLKKRKTLTIYRDSEKSTCFIVKDGKEKEISARKLEKLSKEFNLVYLEFFTVKKEEPVVIAPQPQEKPES